MQDFINTLTVIISHSRYGIKRIALNLQSRLLCKIVNALARSDIITLARYRATVRSEGRGYYCVIVSLPTVAPLTQLLNCSLQLICFVIGD